VRMFSDVVRKLSTCRGKLGHYPIRDAVGYAKFYSRSHDAVIRVYDKAGNVIKTHEHAGEFKGDFVTRLGKRHARA
jgi:hypothetical protein